MTLYNKNEAADLSPRVKRSLKGALETELRARQAARITQGKKSRGSR